MFSIKVAAALYNRHRISDLRLAQQIASAYSDFPDTDYYAQLAVKRFLFEGGYDNRIAA